MPDFISIAPFPLAPVGDWEPADFIATDPAGQDTIPIITSDYII